jgi:hypothetical protein
MVQLNRRTFLSATAALAAGFTFKQTVGGLAPPPARAATQAQPDLGKTLPWLRQDASRRIVASIPGSLASATDRTVEVVIPTQLRTGGPLVIVEIDAAGKAIRAAQPIVRQQDRAMWLVPRNAAAAGASRWFTIYQVLRSPNPNPVVRLLTSVRDEDDTAFVIDTPMFRCYMQQRGSAVSSLVDRDGKDWINYRAQPGVGPRGSFGAFRGLPNFPGPPGMFHPGFTFATTTVVSSNPLQVALRSTSNSGPGWAYDTVVYADRVEMTVRAAPQEYWWLYEGTPGGESPTGGTIDFRTMRAGQPDIGARESWSGDTPWAGFRVPGLGSQFGRTLLVAHTADNRPPSSYYLANGQGSPVNGGDEGAMTVFGFGRDGGKAFVTNKQPQTFVFSMFDATDATQVETAAAALRSVAPVSVSTLQVRAKRPAKS